MHPTVIFRVVEGRDPLLELPAAGLSWLKVPRAWDDATQTISVRFGVRRCLARIRRQREDTATIYVSRGLATELCLIPGLPYQIRWQSGELRIGPVVGVLVDDELLKDYFCPAPKDYIALRYASTGGLLFLFRMEDVDPSSGLIRGYYWRPGGNGGGGSPTPWQRQRQLAREMNERAHREQSPAEAPSARITRFRELAYGFREAMKDVEPAVQPPYASRLGCGKWQAGVFPYPGVIWHRGRRLAPAILAFWTRIIGPKIFNSPLSRLEAFHHCSQLPFLRQYLPETCALTELERVHQFLQQDGAVVLKPTEPAVGELLVVKRRHGHFLVFAGGNNSPVHCRHRHALEERIKPFLSSGRYLVQQWIDLASYRGRRCDFRIVLQKDDRGLWRVRNAVGRFGQAGAPTSHVDGNGYVIPSDNALQRLFALARFEAYRLKMKLLDVSEAVGHALDVSGVVLGELSLNVACDRNQRIWLLDVDAAPEHTLSLCGGDEETFLDLVSGPLQYAAYLDGFGASMLCTHQPFSAYKFT